MDGANSPRLVRHNALNSNASEVRMDVVEEKNLLIILYSGAYQGAIKSGNSARGESDSIKRILEGEILGHACGRRVRMRRSFGSEEKAEVSRARGADGK